MADGEEQKDSTRSRGGKGRVTNRTWMEKYF
jgi:hypothetical protein